MHRFAGGSRLQEARTYAGGEARAQLYDGHAIDKKGKTTSSIELQGLYVNGNLYVVF